MFQEAVFTYQTSLSVVDVEHYVLGIPLETVLTLKGFVMKSDISHILNCRMIAPLEIAD